MWDLIESVPDHCLSFYFSSSLCISTVYINEYLQGQHAFFLFQT